MEAAGTVPGTGIGRSPIQFSPPKRRAAGTWSRRLQYPSKNRVDFGGLPGTAVESWNVGNYYRLNALAQKSRAINHFTITPRSGSTPAASTT
jgi:hypothetical protein